MRQYTSDWILKTHSGKLHELSIYQYNLWLHRELTAIIQNDEKWLTSVEGMSVYTVPQLEKYFKNVGFKSVESHVKKNDYILVVIAQK